MEGTKPLVIVLSRNYSTGLGVIRSLGAAGYTIDLIASTKKKGSSIIASSSRYVRNTIEVMAPKIHEDSGEGLVRVLLDYADKHKEKIIIFPTDDFTASVVDTNRSRLESHFLMPAIAVSSGKTVTELMDKTVQSEMAKAAGLKTPAEWMISLKDDVEIPEDMLYPCFVKPLQSISGHKTEMAVCEDRSSLYDHLLKMQDFFRDRSVLVQEYLNIDKEYDISGVCIDQEIIMPAIIEKTGIAGFERGVAVSGKIMPADILGEAKAKVVELLRQFHYTGMFDIDMHLCGDKLYFSEVNLRSGGLNYAYYLNGVNLPAIYAKAVCGDDYTDEKTVIEKFGRSFVYEKVAWEDYIYKFISRAKLKDYLDKADDLLLANNDDPAPGKVFNRRIRLSAAKQSLKRVLKK